MDPYNFSIRIVSLQVTNIYTHVISMLYVFPHFLLLNNVTIFRCVISAVFSNTGLSKKMDGIWNRYNLKSTGRIYTFCVLKYSEKFKVLDLL